MAQTTQRQALIDSAVRLFHAKGYASTGAREIATAAGVPVGSFTNHFRSKEALGAIALDQYFGRLTEIMDGTLANASRTAGQRLDDYFDLVAARLGEAAWRTGCMIPDLAVEIGGCGDALRLRLLGIMEAQVAAVAQVFAELRIDAGEDLAGFVVTAWHGTLLRMKVERGPEPLNRFRRVLRSIIGSHLP